MKTLKLILSSLLILFSVTVRGQNCSETNEPKLEENQCQIFLKFKNADGKCEYFNSVFSRKSITRSNLANAELVGKCSKQYDYEVLSFTISVSDGWGSFSTQKVEGNKISSATDFNFFTLKSGIQVLIEKIVILKDGKTSTVSFPPLSIP